MIYTTLTKKALKVSFEAHKNQQDKSGMPYVYHPYEVASHMDDEYSTCVALLHDVVEDSDLTLEDLRKEGFPEEVLKAISMMTHDKAIPYLDYVRTIKTNPIARKVKIADLTHNSTMDRLETVSAKDLERIEKYRKALELLVQE